MTASPHRRGASRIVSMLAPVVILAALASTGGSARAGGSQASAVPPGTYTFAQAKQLGIRTPPLPEQVGLPTCRPDPAWKGFASAEEAARALENAPDRTACAADPRNGVFSVGMPAPHSGYHHNGAQTAGKFEGGRVASEVGNPSVDHRSGAPYEFVVARPLAKTDAGNWIETGWSEVSWKANDQYVYTYTHPGDTWYFPSGYSLTVGNYYPFRVRDYASTAAWAEIYWSGSWQRLDTNGSMRCRNTDGTNHCNIEEYLEIYSADSTPHPDMNAPTDGTGVNFRDARLRTQPDTWPLWDTGYSTYTGSVSPYVVCWNSKYYNWRAGKSLTC